MTFGARGREVTGIKVGKAVGEKETGFRVGVDMVGVVVGVSVGFCVSVGEILEWLDVTERAVVGEVFLLVTSVINPTNHNKRNKPRRPLKIGCLLNQFFFGFCSWVVGSVSMRVLVQS